MKRFLAPPWAAWLCALAVVGPAVLAAGPADGAPGDGDSSAKSAPAGAAFYVSPSGSDSASGAKPDPGKDGPFATLGQARNAIRLLKKAGPLPPGGVTVWIRGGTYFVDKGLELAAEDSGTAASPIVYRRYKDEEVHVVGGRNVTGWTVVRDEAVLGRLDPAARGQVYQADLGAQGIGNLGQYRSRGFGRPTVPAALELSFQDRPMTLARWPNQGFVKIAAIPEGQGAGDEHGGTLGNLPGGFHYEGDRPARWKGFQGVWVHGYWAWDWANSYEAIASIDLEKRLIKTAEPYGLYGFRAGQRFYYLNVLEELDEPAEWYLDRASGLLYFWPPAPLADGTTRVSVVEEPLLALRDVEHVRFVGITLECTRGEAVRIRGGRSNLVAACTIRNCGTDAVVVDGGRDHSVVGCDVYETGDAGVRVSGGDCRTLAPGGHVVHNNHLHHIGRWSKCYVPAVLVSGVGVRVSHNLIHDHPHCAVLFGGNEHVIEYNEIHHVCLETGDVGAIYTGRDWTSLGNTIRYNYIHHTGGVGMGSMGVYMDDCSGGATILGNVFHQVQRAVFIGGGRHNRVRNNVFVDCRPAVAIDGRGLDRSPVWHNMVYQTMKKRLEEMNYRQPPYSTRYPELAELDPYYAADAGVPPEGNVLERNICWGGKWLECGWHAKVEMLRIADNVTDKDPLFVDPGRGDFRLRPESPARASGFEPIPIHQIGLVKDEYRQDVAPRPGEAVTPEAAHVAPVGQ